METLLAPILNTLPNTVKLPVTAKFCCIVTLPVIVPPDILNLVLALLYADCAKLLAAFACKKAAFA